MMLLLGLLTLLLLALYVAIKETWEALHTPSLTPFVPASDLLMDENEKELFGKVDGLSVDNIDSVLKTVDFAVGTKKPPALEYIFVEPSLCETGPRALVFVAHGHAAVRYTLPDGKQMVMNVMGLEDRAMITLCEATDYFFGVSREIFDKAEQCGIYHRPMAGLRLETVPDDRILAMHYYFEWLIKRHEAKVIKFGLLESVIANYMRQFMSDLHAGVVESGNCSHFASSGLVEANVLPQKCFFPKMAWIDLYEKAIRNKLDFHVVYYRRALHAVVDPSYAGWDNDAFGPVKPMLWLKTLMYWDLSKFADVIVEVPAGTRRAIVRKHPQKYRISDRVATSRLYKHHHLFITVSLALLLMVILEGLVHKLHSGSVLAFLGIFMYTYH